MCRASRVATAVNLYVCLAVSLGRVAPSDTSRDAIAIKCSVIFYREEFEGANSVEGVEATLFRVGHAKFHGEKCDVNLRAPLGHQNLHAAPCKRT